MPGATIKTVNVLGLQTFDALGNEIPNDDKLTSPALRYDGSFTEADFLFHAYAGNDTLIAGSGTGNWVTVNPSGDPAQPLPIRCKAGPGTTICSLAAKGQATHPARSRAA